jgi:DNA-binding CsgD family transcriptional regulator
MKRFLYPTPTQIQIPLVWSRHGPEALDRRYEGRRAETRVYLNQLIRRLGLDPSYVALAGEVRRQPFGLLDPELLKALVTVLRLYGYIRRDPDTDEWAPVPLTGTQLHAVRLYATGLTQGQIADTLHVNRSCVSARMLRIMRMTSARTVPQALMRVHDMGWLPDRVEREFLRRRNIRGFPYMLNDKGESA